MAQLPEGAIPVDERNVERIERLQNESGAAQGTPQNIPLPEGAIPVEGSFTPRDRGEKLAGEMEHETFIPGISDPQLEALKDEGPAAAGGIAFGLASGGMSLLPAMGMTFLGGAFGESMKDLTNFFVAPEKAPKGAVEQIKSAGAAGVQEAALEFGGRGLIMIAGKAYHLARPKVREGIEAMNQLFEQYGGKFTTAQQTSHWGYQVFDGLTRGSMSGRGVMQAADAANDAALMRWRKDLSAQIASQAREGMTGKQFGQAMLDTLEGGDAAFRKYTSDLYSSLDDLVKTETREVLVNRPVPTSIVDERGKALLDIQTDKVVEQLRPVDATPLKEVASDLFVQMENAANIPKSDFGGDIIDKTLKLDDALTFKAAQDVRSSFIQWAKVAENSGDTKLQGSLNRFADQMTSAMDDAAKRQSHETWMKYQKIKRDAKEGYEAFNDEFIWNFLNNKLSVEKFSDELFRPGNSEAIPRFRKALNIAAKRNPEINPSQVMDNVKQHYLETIMTDSSKILESTPDMTLDQFDMTKGVPLADELKKFFGEDKKRATMDMLFSPREKKLVWDFQKALQRTQAPNEAGVSILAPMFQAKVAGDVVANPGLIAASRAGSFFMSAELIAKAMTREPWISLMTAAAKTPIWAKQAPSIFLKLQILRNTLAQREKGEETLGDDVRNYLSEVGVNLKDAANESIGLDDANIDRIFEEIDSRQ